MRAHSKAAFLTALALVACSGCGGGGGGGTDFSSLTPPTVTSTGLSPAYLLSTGGNVTISSQVTGDGISQVRASVTRPDSSTATLAMSGTAGSYSAVYTAPVNATDSVQTYSVTVRATNTNGVYDDGETVMFWVLNGEAPPLPPPSVP